MDLTRIQRLTEINQNNEALLTGIEYIDFHYGNTQDLTAAKMVVIAIQGQCVSHMPWTLRGARYAIYRAVMEHAKQVMDADDYQAFYNCF